jgi:hypothetical protein
MKKILTILAVVCIGFVAQAQDLVYTHDANGNRIVRETIVLKTAQTSNGNPSAVQDLTEQEQENHETFILGSRVNIYPNPTLGKLQVEIDLPEEVQEATLFVLSTNGQQLQQQSVQSTSTTLDVSAYSSGTYIVRLLLNGRSKEWQVIKE